MLKIAMVADHAVLQERDAVLRTPNLMALAEALVKAGHEVTVYARTGGTAGTEEVSQRGFRMVRLKGRFRTALSDALRATRPDVVHAHCGSVWQAAAAASRGLDVPFVYSLHAAAEDPCVVRDHDAGSSLAAAHAADRVIATFSAQVRKSVVGGVPRQKIAVVPYGVDVEHFNPDGMPAARRLPNRIVAVGDLVPSSGFGTPVAALRALPDTELVIAGGSPRGAHARELRDYARSLDVAGRVRFAGQVSRADLPALLRSADIVACTPWVPVFGVPALEAMACGAAVVANRLGGLADTVVDNVTGIHVPPRKPRDLAAAMLRLLRFRALREQQGAAGRDRAWARYSWAHVAAATVHAYLRAGAIDSTVRAREAAEAAQAGTDRAVAST